MTKTWCAIVAGRLSYHTDFDRIVCKGGRGQRASSEVNDCAKLANLRVEALLRGGSAVKNLEAPTES
jgi:hypothetical protein